MIPWLNLGETEPIIPILGFHGVIKSRQEAISSKQLEMDYPQQDLEKLLNYLIIHDYWFLTTQDLYDFFLKKTREIPLEHQHQKPIMLTFDDGYKTIYTNLLPLLSKLQKNYHQQIKVVLFVNPGTLANRGSMASIHLGCQELRAGLSKGFFDIQSHGENHQNLTKIPQQQIVLELLLARIKLKKCTGDLDPDFQVASHLAYPYGAYSKQVEKYVAKYYLSGFLYNDQMLNYSCFKNYYQIPRLAVNHQHSSQQLIAMIADFQANHQVNSQSKCELNKFYNSQS
jgi:peptidoglycan/xylan/chitin deacetylase (PgdA/CDA1 family)